MKKRGFSQIVTRSKAPKRLRLVALAGLLLSVGWAWQWYNQQPVVGVITTPAIQPGEVKAETTAAPGRYRSEHVSFAYPAMYSDALNTAPSGSIIEQYSMTAHLEKTESRRMSLMVKRASTPTAMREDSAYAFRLNQTDDYQLSQETTAGNLQVDKFTKQDGSEITYFINGNGKYVILAATSNLVNGGFVEDARSIVDSFVWN